MSFKKLALLLLSGAGLYSVASSSAAAGNARERKRIFREKGFWVIAHRGFSGRYPENTMLAFEQAAALPIDAIELDVHSTRDAKIVVIHDPTLDRTTDRNGRVLDFTWDAIKKVDAGFLFDPEKTGDYPYRGKGIVIPLLEDVFRRFPEMKFIIEIKQVMPAIEESVYRLIRKYRMEDKVIVASEHNEPLLRFRNIDSVVATSVSAEEAQELHQSFRMRLANFYRTRGDAVQIPEAYQGTRVVTPAFIRAVKRKGLALHIWTVNEVEDMQRLMLWGVDGIITDFPDRLLHLVKTEKEFIAETQSTQS